MIEAARRADVVLVPIIYESPLEMQVTINALAEIERTTKHIVIVVNKTKGAEFEAARTILRRFYSYPIFEVKQSRAFARAIEHRQSLAEMMRQSPLLAFHYAKPLAQIRAILAHIS